MELEFGVLVFVHRGKREKVEKNPRSNENEVETSQLESLSSWLVSTSVSFDLGFFSTFGKACGVIRFHAVTTPDGRQITETFQNPYTGDSKEVKADTDGQVRCSTNYHQHNCSVFIKN